MVFFFSIEHKYFAPLFQEREVDLLVKECDLAKEKQAELLGDRYET